LERSLQIIDIQRTTVYLGFWKDYLITVNAFDSFLNESIIIYLTKTKDFFILLYPNIYRDSSIRDRVINFARIKTECKCNLVKNLMRNISANFRGSSKNFNPSKCGPCPGDFATKVRGKIVDLTVVTGKKLKAPLDNISYCE
jgi:hypothetical protein